MSEYYLGDILLFGADWPPSKFARCEGQLLPIAGNQALYSLLGTTYGGDGRSNFALPDLRGRTVFGYSPDHPAEPYGQRGGSASVSLTRNNLPHHTHTADTDFRLFQLASTEVANVDKPVAGVVSATPTVDGPIQTSSCIIRLRQRQTSRCMNW